LFLTQPAAAGFLLYLNMLEIVEKNLKNIAQPYAFTEKCKIDLSLSENPLGFSPSVFKVLQKELLSINNYPDPTCKELRKILANKFNISIDRIAIGNGSEQLIDLISRIALSPNNEAIIPKLTFPLFEKGVILAGGKPILSKMADDLSIDFEQIQQDITQATKLIFLCNPNNPTGKILDKEQLLRFIKSVRPIKVVVDEANVEFGGESVVENAKDFDNLIVLKTFSKAFGLAGLRIGIVFASQDLINTLNKIQQPFPVNTLSQKCAIAALKDDEFIRRSKIFMESQRRFLTKQLRKRGFGVVESGANNLLIKVDNLFGSSANFTKLLRENNVSVVDGNNFKGLNNKFIRISPRQIKINKEFLSVIDKLIQRKIK